MDDLEKAILYSYENGGAVDPVLKSQAIAYCQRLKEEAAPSVCRLCVERLSRTSFVQVQFWCLQTIHESLRLRYASMGPSDVAVLRESLISIACSSSIDGAPARVCGGPAFIKNKFAQALVTLIYYEYPSGWPSPFLKLLENLVNGGPVIDVFLRILISLDDEIISMDYPRSNEDIAVAGRIKDAMRGQCIPQIVGAWYKIVTSYRTSDPELAALALDTMRRYITWIDIGLIVNDAIVPLLFELMLNETLHEQLRAAAASCMGAIVSKRMPSQQKITLLKSLCLSQIFSLIARDGESELGSKVAALVIAYATEALDCAKKLAKGAVYSNSMELLEEVLPRVFYVMQNFELDSSVNAVQFLSEYVSVLKSPTPNQMLHLEQILEVIKRQIAYDPTYRNNLDLPDKVGKEEEDQMSEHRKDFFTLLRSVSRAAPDVAQSFIRNLLANSLTSHDVEGVEATLSLFYCLGETISDEGMRVGSGQLKEMVPLLLSARFTCHSHRIVALVFLETITRYTKFVQENAQYIPHLLAAFLDDRGIHHQNSNVSRRASYLFMRAVKLLKAQLIPYIETILQSLQDTVARFTSLDLCLKDIKNSSSEDGSHTFEAIGLLIGMEDISSEKQSEYLSALLTPLCKQVELLLSTGKIGLLEESSSQIATVQQIIMAINALSKGFSERLVMASRPAIGIMFKQTLDALLQVLVAYPEMEPLRTKITSFLHRMIEILGVSVFPYLPVALEKLLAKSEPKELLDFLVLINQLICKFSTSISSILEEIFPVIASRLFHVLPKEFPSGPGSNTEEIRELQELQRTFYTFLHVLITHDLSSVLLSPKGRGYLDATMQLLLFTSCSHKEVVVRKICVQIVTRLIKDWCSQCNSVEKIPGFRSFIIESFSTNCCLFSLLDNSFNFRDANTLVLFGEILVAQKIMYEKFGDDFLAHFLSKGLSVAHCPQDLAEQYYQKLKDDDMKSLKAFFQSLVLTLRQLQNGSLVFR